jgi:hypothetical protein
MERKYVVKKFRNFFYRNIPCPTLYNRKTAGKEGTFLAYFPYIIWKDRLMHI